MGTLESELVGKVLGFEEVGLSVGEQRKDKKMIFLLKIWNLRLCIHVSVNEEQSLPFGTNLEEEEEEEEEDDKISVL